jgi:hypothetical protein
MELTYEERLGLKALIDLRRREGVEREQGARLATVEDWERRHAMNLESARRYTQRARVRKWAKQGFEVVDNMRVRCLTCNRTSVVNNWQYRHEQDCPNANTNTAPNRGRGSKSG